MDTIALFRPSYVTEEILNNLAPVLDSGWCGPGSQCKEFEKKFNEFIGSKYCHYLNSATAGLHLALKLLDLPPGSKVLTTPLTFCSTNAVILYEQLEPVFVDIDERDLSIDLNDLVRKMEKHKSNTVIWVHHGGHASAYFDYLYALEKDRMNIIEDCAHAMGGFYSDGTRIGSKDKSISVMSFQAVKNLPTADSGMIVVPDEEKLNRVKRLAWLGIDKDTFARTNSSENDLYKWRYSVNEIGHKYNGNDIMATIALTQLKYLDRDNAYRMQVRDWYVNNLHEHKEKIKIVHQCRDSSHHLFVVRVNNREEVISALKANGIAPGVHYLPNYNFPVFAKYYSPGDCPTCERVSEEILSLPNHLLLTKKDIDKVCEVLIDAAKSNTPP
jgi:dTDP-4-amino-4,6-dideoxygalactose transaminase